jgi:hypothetical protein
MVIYRVARDIRLGRSAQYLIIDPSLVSSPDGLSIDIATTLSWAAWKELSPPARHIPISDEPDRSQMVHIIPAADEGTPLLSLPSIFSLTLQLILDSH